MFYLPAVVFGFVLSTFLAVIFHLILDGGLGRLFAFIIASWIGFLIGHFVGEQLNLDIGNFGSIHIAFAVLGSLICLVLVYWLSHGDLAQTD